MVRQAPGNLQSKYEPINGAASNGGLDFWQGTGYLPYTFIQLFGRKSVAISNLKSRKPL